MNSEFPFKFIFLVPLSKTRLYHVGTAHWGIPCISQKEEERFAPVPAIFGFLAAQGSEKLSVGFVYSLLKSVGNSCYFGRLQAMCRVIFLQQHWVSFFPIPKSSPLPAKAASTCHSLLFFFHGAFCSLFYIIPFKSHKPQGSFQTHNFKDLWSIRNLLADPTEARMKFSSCTQVFLVKGLAAGFT